MIEIINEDCLQWMRNQPSNIIDICVSSPPYNIGIAYNTYGDKLTANDYIEWQKQVWTEVCRLLKPTGHLFLNVAPTRADPLLPYKVAQQVPWKIQNSIVWSKRIEIDGFVRGHGTTSRGKKYLPSAHEMMFHFTQNGNTPIDIERSGVPYQPEWAEYNFKRTGRTWRPSVNNWHIPYETCGCFGADASTIKGDVKHPAIYPRELVRHCLRLAGCSEGDVVFDPFSGTGTTMVVAKEFGLNGYACEIDNEYYKFSLTRLQ